MSEAISAVIDCNTREIIETFVRGKNAFACHVPLRKKLTNIIEREKKVPYDLNMSETMAVSFSHTATSKSKSDQGNHSMPKTAFAQHNIPTACSVSSRCSLETGPYSFWSNSARRRGTANLHTMSSFEEGKKTWNNKPVSFSLICAIIVTAGYTAAVDVRSLAICYVSIEERWEITVQARAANDNTEKGQ